VPLYRYQCTECKEVREVVQQMDAASPAHCGGEMVKLPTAPGLIRMKGMGYPSRRKWCESWTPDSPAFSTGSLHGEHY